MTTNNGKWLHISNHSKDKKDQLINTEPLKKVIECTLISPYIKDEKPISLLIVAKAESGKTTAMKMYRENKGVVYLTDCTAYGITRDILPKIVSGEIKTIMIPDLITPLSKSTKTSLPIPIRARDIAAFDPSPPRPAIPTPESFSFLLIFSDFSIFIFFYHCSQYLR